MKSRLLTRSRLVALAATALTALAPAFAWEPTKTVTFVVPAGPGGGADQMARFVQGMVTKHNLMKQPMVVENKSGGAGAEGFLDVKGASGDAHKIVITLSNLFTTPLATGVPFSWKDLTPVSMMALDQFVLWVNSDTPYKTPKDYIDAVQVAGKHIDSSVNNPIEAVEQWRAGQVRPLCVFDNERMPYKAKVTKDMSWGDIPTCKEMGLNVEYQMLRGIFMPSGVTKEQVDFYVDLLKKTREMPEWKDFTEKAAFNQTALTGEAYKSWVAKEEKRHYDLMKEA